MELLGHGAVAVQNLELGHEATIDPVLEPKNPFAFERQSRLRPECSAVAEIQEREKIFLRPIILERPPFDLGAEVVGQVGALVNGVHTGLRRLWVIVHRRAVANREQIVVAFDLQRGSRAHEPPGVGRQSRVGKHWMAHRAGHPDQSVVRHGVAVFEHDDVIPRRRHAAPGNDLNIALPRVAPNTLDETPRVAGQHLIERVHQRQLDRRIRADAEPLPKRERELHAPGTAPHDHHPKARARLATTNLLYQRLGSAHELGDGSGGQRVLPDAGEAPTPSRWIRCRRMQRHTGSAGDR